LNGITRDATVTGDFVPPTTSQIDAASASELRSMLQACVTEHAKLKMEAAHHKLQYSLLSIQAEEDSKRAAVEHEMTRKEVEALRMVEHSRQARHDLTTSSDASQAKYFQLEAEHQQALSENEGLHKKFKAARKVIQQKEEEISGLTDERDMLLNRIRENREHFHILCSPGGMFHGAVTPKQSAPSRPSPSRSRPVEAHQECAVHVFLADNTDRPISAGRWPASFGRPSATNRTPIPGFAICAGNSTSG
jgi:acetyl-CoA acyltransferase 1